MSHPPHHQQASPVYSPPAYAQVPAVPAAVHTAPTNPPLVVAVTPAPVPAGEHGHALGAAFPPTPYTPYFYHGQQGSPEFLSPMPLHDHAASLQPSNVPISMPEPQRPLRAPPLPHRPHEPLLQPAPFSLLQAGTQASVISPPITATTQLLMPSPPSNNSSVAVTAHLFEEPVASSQGSSSYLVERVQVGNDSGHAQIADARQFLVAPSRSPPTLSASVPIAASTASPSSASESLTRPPATTAVAPPSSSVSLSHQVLPDWAKDPDDDRPPIRPPVYLTPPFGLKIVFVLVSFAGIITIRTIISAYAAAVPDEPASPAFWLAYQWLFLITLAYALTYLGSFSSCLYNRQARKVSVSPQRQAWKLRARRWLLLPAEVSLTLTWLIMTLIIGLANREWALYVSVCSVNQTRVGVSCTQATTMLVLAAMMTCVFGLSVGQLALATRKNQRKVNEFKAVETDTARGGANEEQQQA